MKTKTYTVKLTETEHSRIKRIGLGNFSQGVRTCSEKYAGVIPKLRVRK